MPQCASVKINLHGALLKLDYKKEFKYLYNPSPKSIVIVDVPAMNFLMIDGQGDPNTSRAYRDAIEALYTVSYAMKFMIKNGTLAIDYGVMPLEGLWWVDDMARFSVNNKTNWKWTAMIMQPEYVTQDLLSAACKQVEKKKNPVALPNVRFESFSEGNAAQTMHLGPFLEEGQTINRIHDFIRDKGYSLFGKHHEIYLSDIRKSSSETWKTIIRQPMRKS